MSDSEAKPEAKRKRGRPPQYGDTAVKGAVRQQWHRNKQRSDERRMASLLLELWSIRPDYWCFSEMDALHAETIEQARKIVGKAAE